MPSQVNASTLEARNWAYADIKQDLTYVGFNDTLVHEVCSSPARSRTQTNWCDACVGPRKEGTHLWCACVCRGLADCYCSLLAVTGTVDDFIQNDMWTENIRAMGSCDWMALFLCMVLIGLSCLSEMKDVCAPGPCGLISQLR